MIKKQNQAIKVLMVAINGYGHYYLKTLLEEVPGNKAVLAGVVDPGAKKSGYINLIHQKNIPVYNSIEEYFENSHEADLTVISSPPQYHVEQAILAMENESNVLVDKPVGIGAESIQNLIRVSGENNKWVEVGYQWSYSNAIQCLKRDILDGTYGDPVKGKAICLWPRDFRYYSRNSWAGKIRDSLGNLIYDSPANNACAHFLHNLLFLFGDRMNKSVFPGEISCERYRANNIDSFDTLSLNVITENGLELMFYVSHATEMARDPEFELQFTGGTVKYNSKKEGVVGKTREGDVKIYGSPDDDHQFKKLFHAIDLCRNEGDLICPPEAAIAHTICIDLIHSDNNEIISLNPDNVVDDGNRRYFPGLNEKMDLAYNSNTMLSNYKV